MKNMIIPMNTAPASMNFSKDESMKDLPTNDAYHDWPFFQLRIWP